MAPELPHEQVVGFFHAINCKDGIRFEVLRREKDEKTTGTCVVIGSNGL